MQPSVNGSNNITKFWFLWSVKSHGFSQEMDSEKIKELAVQKIVKELSRFIGFYTYYRRFINRFAHK